MDFSQDLGVGAYQISLTVTDNQGAEGSAGASIVITENQGIDYTITIEWWDDSANGVLGDGNGIYRLLRWAQVELYDDDGIIGDDFLGSGNLNGNGTYTFTNIQSNDPGGPDLYVKIILDCPSVKFFDYGLADLFTQVTNNVTASMTSLDRLDQAEQSTYAYVFNTIQDLHSSWLKITGDNVPQVTVRLLPEWLPSKWFTRTSYEMESFLWFFDYNRLNLGYKSNHAECSAWNKFSIAHEYGHHIMYKAYGDTWPQAFDGGKHAVVSETNPGFALAEGWAEFVQNAMHTDWRNDLNRTYINSANPNPKFFGKYSVLHSGSHIETNAWHIGPDIDEDNGVYINPNGNSGSLVEGAVASILWDIFDSDDSDEPWGGIQNGFLKIWSVISSSPHPQDILQFYHLFILKYPGDKLALAEIYSAHGIPTITPSGGGTVSLPDDSASVYFPPNAIPHEVFVSIVKVNAASVPPPSGGWQPLGDVYDFSAVDAQGNPITNFSVDLTLTLKYDPNDLNGLDEQSLTIYYYDLSAGWVPLLPSFVDTVNHTVMAKTNHFSWFGIFGIPEPSTFLLFGAGLISILVFARRKLKKKK